jgi:two-component system KDP operon response regulator KdpE
MTGKLLLVDDAQESNTLLQRALSRDGYEVRSANSGAEGLRLAFDFRPDLILLDVMMPGMDGWTTLERLREFSDVPVIMLTALGSDENIQEGLSGGADDYMTKPFSMAELKARIRAVERPTAQSRCLYFDGGRLLICPPSQEVLRDGLPVSLTPTEYRLLLCLVHNAGCVVNTDQILKMVWGPGYEGSEPNVKLYVWYLRQKIEADPRHPRYILTKRGGGYYLNDLPPSGTFSCPNGSLESAGPVGCEARPGACVTL